MGNVLCGDDGLGVIVADRLIRDFEIPEGVRVVDGGTLGLSLLPLLQEFDAAIFLDAVRSGDAPPGTLIRIDGDAVVPAVRQHISVHQIGVADLLDAARLTDAYPSELVLLGLVPGSLDLGLGLSPPLRRKLPLLVEAVVVEIERFGFSVHAADKTGDPAGSPRLLDLGL
ncbi:MAG: hydrogenase maturation protease [Thermoanaerobaculia bacterium]